MGESFDMGVTTDDSYNKCVFFLGAGFTKDAGVPTQRELFPEYLFRTKENKKEHLLKFISDIYSFYYERPYSLSSEDDKNNYPILEDIFSVIDNAVINGEYLQDYSPSELQKIRDDFVFGIIDLINQSVTNCEYIKNFARVLTNWRLQSENSDPFSIITTNWDIVLLNRFREHHDEIIEKFFSENKNKLPNLRELKEEERKNLALIDYCLYTHPLEDKNNHVPSLKIKCMGYKNIKILYLHGCPTWLYCRKCKKIFSPPSYNKSKEYIKNALNDILDRRNKPKQCPQCNNISLSPILIMPTYYKIIQNVHLLDVWQNAAMELQEAMSLFFIGYSLPEADYLIRNLLVSNIKKSANIYISSTSGFNSDTIKKYRQLFGNRVKEDNILKGTGKVVVEDICKQIENREFKCF